MLSHPDVAADVRLGHPLALLREPSDALEGLTPGVLVAGELLGRRVGELHRSLASVLSQAFVPEPVTSLSQRSTYQSMRNTASRAMRALAFSGLIGSRLLIRFLFVEDFFCLLDA